MSPLGVTVMLAALGAAPATQSAPVKPTTIEQARRAVEQGVAFLVEDAADWRKEHGCATCHHGIMTIWGLSEAKGQGYAVDASALADVLEWTKSRIMPRLERPRDPRPGWRLVNQQAIYLGMMSRNLPVLSRDEINTVAVHLARHQEDEGSWEVPPAANGAPPIWESREVVALLAYLAWEPHAPADSAEATRVQAGREKAAAWLRDAPPTDSTQADALRLLLDVREGKDPSQRQSRVDRLLARQNSDGGWSQVKDLASDAFASGQALYALSFAGVANDRPEVRRAVAFLVATQDDDGSWPMTSRNHPGVKSTRTPIRNPIPITYFGSAWATIGLARSVPSPPDTPAKRQHAFDEIQSFHGTYAVDESRPDRPVVRVDLGNYEVEDQQVAEFARLLQAFPQLAALRFKSPKITDAGLAPLQSLTQLKELSLEGATVSDGAVRELEKSLPGLKVNR